MSSRQPSRQSSQSQSDPKSGEHEQHEERPTLPPIRQIFGSELSQAIPPQQSRQGLPHIERLALGDDPRRMRPQSPARGVRANMPSTHAHPQPSPYGTPVPSSSHSRNTSDPAYRPQGYVVPSQQRHSHLGPGYSHPSSYDAGYPYSASQPTPVASSSRGTDTTADRSSASRYECQYCGRGFTRPSSLKIHLYTHTGERPFTCPVEGCGRSFSVLSNMRRHARVHERGNASQAEEEDDADAGEDEQ